MVVGRRKFALHTSSHLTPLEAWRSAVSTTSESRRVSSKVQLENCARVVGLGQIWRACYSQMRKFSASHLFWLVRTCPQYSDYVRLSRNVIFCTFESCYSSVLHPILVKLHILTRLIESFPTVWGLSSCFEVKLSIPLRAMLKDRPKKASSAVIF